MPAKARPTQPADPARSRAGSSCCARSRPAEAHGPPRKLLLGELAAPLEPLAAAVPRAAGAAAHRASARGHAAAGLRHPSAAHALHGAPARSAPGTRSSAGGSASTSARPRRTSPCSRSGCGRSANATARTSCWSAGASAASSRASWPSAIPELIAKVITMGTPFSGSLYANNAWRDLPAGHRPFGRAAAGRGAGLGQAAGRDGGAVEPARRGDRAAQRLRPARRARPGDRVALHPSRLRAFARGDPRGGRGTGARLTHSV